jgi:hypothetical protein
MNDATGGRTQMAGLVAASTIAVVLLFLTGPLRYVPIPALGAVLVKAGLSLVDLPALKHIFKIDRSEFTLSVAATLGVVKSWGGVEYRCRERGGRRNGKNGVQRAFAGVLEHQDVSDDESGN